MREIGKRGSVQLLYRISAATAAVYTEIETHIRIEAGFLPTSSERPIGMIRCSGAEDAKDGKRRRAATLLCCKCVMCMVLIIKDVATRTLSEVASSQRRRCQAGWTGTAVLAAVLIEEGDSPFVWVVLFGQCGSEMPKM